MQQHTSPPSARNDFPWLVADIGGTHARFGLVTDATLAVRHVQQLRAADHAGPAEAARCYLGSLATAVLALKAAPPRLAAFAVATAVTGDSIAFTNSHWRFSRQALQTELGLAALLLPNDFEALALALPTLTPSQLRAHGALPLKARGGPTDALSDAPTGALAVVGPGTGLGVAGMVHTRHGWQPVPGEGGHATLAPADDFESAVLAQVRRRYEHVSAERLLSGIGLPVLHQAVAEVMGLPPAATSYAGTRQADVSTIDPLSAEQIGSRALAGSDAVCVRTVDVFCALLGGFAGNLALTLGARGGVFIGGGIVPRWGELFFASRFRERFEAKGRFRNYLEAIPTALIIDTQVALGGAAVAIQRHLADTGTTP